MPKTYNGKLTIPVSGSLYRRYGTIVFYRQFIYSLKGIRETFVNIFFKGKNIDKCICNHAFKKKDIVHYKLKGGIRLFGKKGRHGIRLFCSACKENLYVNGIYVIKRLEPWESTYPPY